MLLIGALSANQYLEGKKSSFAVSAKRIQSLSGCKMRFLSGALSIIIFKADSIVFGVVKLKKKSPYQSGPAKSRSQPGTDVNTPDEAKRTVI